MQPRGPRRIRVRIASPASRTLLTTTAVLLLVPFASPEAKVRLALPSPDAPAFEWTAVDGPTTDHYASLADVHAANVSALEVAWVYRTGDGHEHEEGVAGTAFEATPIMVDGRLYVSTPRSRAVALDAETGEEIWTFDPGIDASDADHTMTTSRGLSTWLDPQRGANQPCSRRIFVAAYDARLIALDAATGWLCEDFGAGGVVALRNGVARLEGRREQYKQTAPPAVIADLVIVGSSIFDSRHADAPSGVVRAFDARSGSLRWAWEPVAGVGGWDADGVWVPAGAANTWASITVDEVRNLVFVPTGSASPDHFGGMRPGDNRYANSLVALRGSTGEVVWHFQAVHHDLWDYDLPAPAALVSVERNGEDVPAVVLTTKMGYVFVFHRETGEPLFPIEERPVPTSDVPGEWTSPTQPTPLLPRPLTRQELRPADAWGLTPLDRGACRRLIAGLRHDGMYAPPSVRGTVAMPGFLGGMEWGGVSYDHDTGILVTNVNHLAMAATLLPADELPEAINNPDGRSSVASQTRTPYGVRRCPILSPIGIPCSPPPWGALVAVDMRSGEVRWEVPLGTLRDLVGIPTPSAWGSPNLGGPLVVGGLVFIGATMDRRFRAFDLESGELLWEDELPASAQATPMTYRARRGGRQYIVVAAGGHSGIKSKIGDCIVAYALPVPRVVAEDAQ